MVHRNIARAALATTLLSVPGLQAAPVSKEPTSAVLVELFTSEGCSSCPPADALLRQIDGKRTPSGQLVVVLSEHVTYWDRLGWKDPHSADEYTQRQEAYARRFRIDGPYTPQMVVNGREEFVGSDQAKLLQAFQRSPASPVSLHIESVSLNGERLRVSFTASGMLATATPIFAAIADDLDETKVPRGENSGRTLSHVAVARQLTQVATLLKPGEQVIEIPMPVDRSHRQPQHLILFAQASGLGEIFGVTSTSIPDSLPQTAASPLP